jgi:hypothetical protein
MTLEVVESRPEAVMSRILIPNSIREQIQAAKHWPIEFCDENGLVLGYLNEPARTRPPQPKLTEEEINELFPPEEIEASLNDPRPSIPIDEAMRRLGLSDV